MRQPGFKIVDVDAGAALALGSTDNAFGRVRAVPEERRCHPQLAAFVLRRAQRVFELGELISAAIVFERHVVREIVDDARCSVALRLCFDDCQSGYRGDLIEQVAGCRKGRLR